MAILRTLWAIALTPIAAGCASTGSVPRPFPTPAHEAPRVASAADADDLVGTAMELRGVPYRPGGADRRGFDCSGFTQYVFAQHGIALPREVREQFATGAAVAPDEVQPGDLLFFSIAAPGATHVAIAVGGGRFVHAPSSTGVVRIERLGSTYWSRRFLGVRRVL
jgi:cell wall-associated NlpC family hydrolase